MFLFLITTHFQIIHAVICNFATVPNAILKMYDRKLNAANNKEKNFSAFCYAAFFQQQDKIYESTILTFY